MHAALKYFSSTTGKDWNKLPKLSYLKGSVIGKQFPIFKVLSCCYLPIALLGCVYCICIFLLC